MNDVVEDIVSMRNAVSVPPQALALLQSAFESCLTDAQICKNTRALANIATAVTKLEGVRLKCNLALAAMQTHQVLLPDPPAPIRIEARQIVADAKPRREISFCSLVEACNEISELERLKSVAMRAKSQLGVDLDSDRDCLGAVVSVANTQEEVELLFQLKVRVQQRLLAMPSA